ncbi:hypothetical protein WN943_004554 [Citrus x changshan-huyou]
MTESSGNASVSSSSSLSSNFPDAEDDHTIASILASEENAKAEGQLGKRLSHLDSIPHTPRINGEIPDVNDASFDHERLSERLTTYGLAELQIEGDGNCQFRALADQLFRNPDYHKHVRKEIFKQLKHFRKLYEGYVPMNYKGYLRKMKKSGEWGDHVTLQAAADRDLFFITSACNCILFSVPFTATLSYLVFLTSLFYLNPSLIGIRPVQSFLQFQAKICLVTSFRDTCYVEIIPKDKNPTRELWLSFWSEVHYNSLYATGDVPTRKPRKKYWLF